MTCMETHEAAGQWTVDLYITPPTETVAHVSLSALLLLHSPNQSQWKHRLSYLTPISLSNHSWSPIVHPQILLLPYSHLHIENWIQPAKIGRHRPTRSDTIACPIATRTNVRLCPQSGVGMGLGMSLSCPNLAEIRRDCWVRRCGTVPRTPPGVYKVG